jgi:heptosyltransferase-3
MSPKRIIISRTDSIGDVILTLPLAGILKQYFPDLHIIFLGSSYTKDIIKCCKHIDEFIDWAQISILPENEAINYLKNTKADTIIHVFPRKEIASLAKKAQIKNRIGTTNRLYHWFTCNKLLRFSRKNSELHEAQLNVKLLKPFGIDKQFDLFEFASFYGFESKITLSENILSLIDKQKFNLILHPKSKGSAREWGLENFSKLIEILPKNKFKIFVSGTSFEAELMQTEIIEKHKDSIIDITGKFSLAEFIAFIALADGLIAASTGPLHIAAALGKVAIGIYPPIKPMHPGRWQPIGEKATYLVSEKNCEDCRKSNDCQCMRNISPENLLSKLEPFINL